MVCSRLAVYSTPLMIAGDFNIHVDNATDSDAGDLSDMLTSHSLLLHIKKYTNSLPGTLPGSVHYA